MGIIAKLKGELVDIIEWIDDSRSTLAWRYPRYQNEIKNGAITGMKLGLAREYMIGGLDPEVKDAIENAVRQLAKLGAVFHQFMSLTRLGQRQRPIDDGANLS